jgi:glycosyltransferase involved in cell wall biosynthesis
VLVPVWEGEAFVAETLDALLSQTHEDFVALVSVDHGRDRSVEVCRRSARDPRIQVFEQRSRLGWVANATWLLRRVRTPYYCILPHDDLPAPGFLESLHELLAQHPAAAVAYCDLQGFGSHDRVYARDSLVGSRAERVVAFLREHLEAVAYRGLVRRPVSGAPPIPSGLRDDFAADTLWLAKHVRRGELVRLPEVLYRKRYHPRSAHASWHLESDADRALRWREHCDALAAVFYRDLFLSKATGAATRVAWRERRVQSSRGFFPTGPVEITPDEPRLVDALHAWLRHPSWR